MHILVTAGNTQVLIDKVRCITNVFTGRTGARLALHAHARGHAVILLTSHPEVVAELNEAAVPPSARWDVRPYRMFEDLQELMGAILGAGGVDALVHCAAVSDYRSAGVYAPALGTRFSAATGRWEGAAPTLVDRAAGKVKSDEPELWLRLTRAPKLVDRVRSDWGFRGVLVKFKLEVGLDDARLLEVAENSRRQSGAELMVANTLEGADAWAFLGPLEGHYHKIPREELPSRLFGAVERLHQERGHG